MICYCSKLSRRRRLRKQEELGGTRRLGRCPVIEAVCTMGSLMGETIERGKQSRSVFSIITLPKASLKNLRQNKSGAEVDFQVRNVESLT